MNKNLQAINEKQTKSKISNTLIDVFVGSKQIEIRDAQNSISFPVLIHYPTNQVSMLTDFGPFKIDVCPNANILEGQFPLVIISHGNGGSRFLYRTISTYLAKNGYVVAMIEHYGNNRNNNDLSNSIENLQYRPRHVSLTIDSLLSDKFFGNSISLNDIFVIGHSFGGYTALASAGGEPWTKGGQKVEVQNDTRIKALVLMAPAVAFFLPSNSLKNVIVPIFLLTAEKDDITLQNWIADIVMNGVPDKSKVTLKTIENAGHFSFISPFPSIMNSSYFPPSTDPEGFNREAFHKQLPIDILNFLENN